VYAFSGFTRVTFELTGTKATYLEKMHFEILKLEFLQYYYFSRKRAHLMLQKLPNIFEEVAKKNFIFYYEKSF